MLFPNYYEEDLILFITVCFVCSTINNTWFHMSAHPAGKVGKDKTVS